MIDELQDDFTWQISDSNTYSLVEATQTHLNLVLLYNHLLRTLLNGQLPIDNAPTDTTQLQYFSDNLEEITQPRALVNFVSRRITAWRDRITTKHDTLKAEVTSLQNESLLLKAELGQLNQELDALIVEAKAVGIDTTAVEADLAALDNGDGGFKTQGLPLVIGGVAFRFAAPVIGNFVRQAGVQLVNTVLANPAAAGRAVLAVTGLIAAGNNSSRQTQKKIKETQDDMDEPNQSPEQMAAHQAQLAQQQALLNEINGVMLKVKKKQGEANQSQNKTEKTKSQSKDKCGGKQPCNNIFPSRQSAFQQAKRDLGVARNQRPLNGKPEKEPLTYSDRGEPKNVIGKDGKPVQSREYHYNRVNEKGQQEEVVIQEHSQGHQFSDGGIEGPHFNVRPASNTGSGKIDGTRDHYYFEK